MLAQLKRLEVGYGGWGVSAPPEALGQVLWACRQLEEVDVSRWTSQGEMDTVQEPWLLLDPNSTSISTAVGPPLPLRSLKVSHVPGQLVTGWLHQQQQQLGRTLHSLEVCTDDCEDLLDVGQLTGLVALRDLKLSGGDVTASQPLGTMSSLTQLELPWAGCTTEAVEAVCTLPNVQHLSVAYGYLQQLPDAMCGLKHLTCLDISYTRIEQLPEDLGVWCPGLVQLEASYGCLAAVPASVGSLTRLKLANSHGEQLVLHTTLTNLRQLDLSEAEYEDVTLGISSLTALELLNVCAFIGGQPLGDQGMAALRHLTRLTHLNLQDNSVQSPRSFTVIGALQQLTFLDLSYVRQYDGDQCSSAGWVALGRAEPLPNLQHLNLSTSWTQHDLSVLAPWLGRLTALTQLGIAGHPGGNSSELLHLSPQLEELYLSNMGLQAVPPGLQHLSKLRTLSLAGNSDLCQLPSWFSRFHSLEWLTLSSIGLQAVPPELQHLSALQQLSLSGNPSLCQLPDWCSQLSSLVELNLRQTGVVTEQPVLAQMLGLRTVFVPPQAAVCDAVLPGVIVLPLAW
jgi:Leucine-rich repeat (LRR) protein